MVQINSNSRYNDDFQKNLFGFFCSIFISVSMIVTVLGIKFKWFKHRMNLEPINTQMDSRMNQGTYRNSNSSSQTTSKYTTYNQVHGVFRKREDTEVAIERPGSLPPVRIRGSTRKHLNLTPNERFSQPLPSVPHVRDEQNYQESTQTDNQYPRVHELIIPDTPVADKNEVEERNIQDEANFVITEPTNSNETPQVKKRLFLKQEKNRTVHFDTREDDIDPQDKKVRRPTGLAASTWSNSETDNEDSISDSNELIRFANNELHKLGNEENNLNAKRDGKLKQNFDSLNERLNTFEYQPGAHELREKNDGKKDEKYSGTDIPDYFSFDQMQDELRVLSRKNQNLENGDDPKQCDGIFNGNEKKMIINRNSSNCSEVFEEPIELIPISIEDLSELERRENKYQDELYSSGEIQQQTKHSKNEHKYDEDFDGLTNFVSISKEKFAELETSERFNFSSTMASNTSKSQVSTLTGSSSFEYLKQDNRNESEEMFEYYEEHSNIDQFARSLRFQSIDSLEGARKQRVERNVIKFETSSDEEDSDDDKMSNFDKNKLYQEVPEFQGAIQNVPKPEPRTTITKSMENLNTTPPKPSLRLSLENVNAKNTEGQLKPFRPSLQKSLESVELKEIEKENNYRKSFELEDITDQKVSVQKKVLRIDE